jgi:hypothetical protein
MVAYCFIMLVKVEKMPVFVLCLIIIIIIIRMMKIMMIMRIAFLYSLIFIIVIIIFGIYYFFTKIMSEKSTYFNLLQYNFIKILAYLL